MSKAAFIGLGAMGYPMAGHLARKHPTLVYNRTASKAVAHSQEYPSTAAALPQLAEADILFTCVPISADVHQLALDLLPHLRPGTLWVDHTSGEPALARTTAELLASRGVTYLDAPLSGGVAGAQNARVTVMVGGEEAALERARPWLDSYAAKIVRVGPIGAGHAVKAVNNALLALNIWGLGEGLVALTRQGVDAGLALEVINASSGRSNVSENLFPSRVVNRSFPATFALGLLAKDLGICMKVLSDAGTPAPVLRQLNEFFAVARQQIGAEVDHTAAVKLLEAWAQQEIR
jgi:3-hydroxyisobutyrate dehydrogenase